MRELTALDLASVLRQVALDAQLAADLEVHVNALERALERCAELTESRRMTDQRQIAAGPRRRPGRGSARTARSHGQRGAARIGSLAYVQDPQVACCPLW